MAPGLAVPGSDEAAAKLAADNQINPNARKTFIRHLIKIPQAARTMGSSFGHSRYAE
jgi:hypothetical protein